MINHAPIASHHANASCEVAAPERAVCIHGHAQPTPAASAPATQAADTA